MIEGKIMSLNLNLTMKVNIKAVVRDLIYSSQTVNPYRMLIQILTSLLIIQFLRICNLITFKKTMRLKVYQVTTLINLRKVQ